MKSLVVLPSCLVLFSRVECCRAKFDPGRKCAIAVEIQINSSVLVGFLSLREPKSLYETSARA